MEGRPWRGELQSGQRNGHPCMTRPPAVIVTGAGGGIGRATALHLDGLGLRVFAGIRREADGIVLARLASDRLTPIVLDVTSPTDVAAAAHRVSAQLAGSRFAGIVSSAGVAIAGPVELLPLELWRQEFEVNVLGLVALVQAFVPLLRQAQGRLVAIGSVAGRLAQPMAAPYCASKFAVEAVVDALRIELKPWGIAVALVQPTAVAGGQGLAMAAGLLDHVTDPLRDAYQPGFDKFGDVRLRRRQAGRGLKPQSVAEAVTAALLSAKPRARYPVGFRSRLLLAFARGSPDWLKDELMWRRSGLRRVPLALTHGSPPGATRRPRHTQSR
jgi:NAD(P)-dependent dehydrogenase (short-subunit alcohol dehydrogenase family)